MTKTMYVPTYMCRFCKHTFCGEPTESAHTVALVVSSPTHTEVHYAQDYNYKPHIGVGELIGYEVITNAE